MPKIVVSTVERWAAPRGSQPGLKGPIVINKVTNADGTVNRDKTIFLNQPDYVSALSKRDLPPDSSCEKLKGATLIYDELVITDDMLKAGGGQHEVTSNGRKFMVKTAGKRIINPDVLFNGFNYTETDINISRGIANNVEARIRRNNALQAGMAERAAARPTIEEPLDDVADNTGGGPKIDTPAEKPKEGTLDAGGADEHKDLKAVTKEGEAAVNP